jgi:integrase
MAYYRKLPSGRWRAEVERNGERVSQGGFQTKAEASAWATSLESEMLAGKRGQWPRKTLQQAIERYELEVSPLKGSFVFEQRRFAALKREYPWLVSKPFVEITTDDLARLRDARLKLVKESTVRREFNTLSNVWTVAGEEWKWCPKDTPWSDLRMPEDGPPRDRRISWREIRLMVRRMGYAHNEAPVGMLGQLAYAWLIALRTAMRAGEVMRLTIDDVDLERRVVRLSKHKTRRYTGKERLVPIFPRAAELLRILVGQARDAGRHELFTLTNDSRDALFRKVRKQMLIGNMTFHDSRGEALTLLSRKVDVMTLAKISGHKNINLLLNTYYRETAAQIAARLT